MQKTTTRNIAYYGLLIALNVILTRMGSIRIGAGGVEFIRIGFGGYPIIFAGIVFGPLAGAIVGSIGDIIGYFINPMGGYMPHFTMVAALTGIIPGIIAILLRDKNSLWKLVVAIGIGQIITSIYLTPYFLDTLFGIPMVTTIPGRIITQAVQVPLYAYMTKILISRLQLRLDTN